jgi:hypothetical protein
MRARFSQNFPDASNRASRQEEVDALIPRSDAVAARLSFGRWLSLSRKRKGSFAPVGLLKTSEKSAM